MESTQDPSWESLMDLLPNPTNTGPFAAGSGWSVGFGTHRLTPKAMELLPEGISFSISSTLLGFFFFHLAPFIPFPKSPVFRERLWSSLIRNLTSPPVTFVSLAPGAIPNFKIWLWPSQEAQRQIPCWLQSVPAGKGLGDQYWPKLPGLFPLYPMG